MMDVVNMIFSILKAPFIAVFKILLFILNLIPLPIYEIHGLKGFSADLRPDLRTSYLKIQGEGRLNLGFAIIAHTRGAIFRAHLASGQSCMGVYSEVYQDIVKKWGL